MQIKNDCRNFPQDRPCKFHKTTGIKCDKCTEYNPAGFKILIIKLDAIGDVLRTTAILPALKNKYPKSHITWITLKSAKDLFIENHLVDTVLDAQDAGTIARLGIEKFNLVINLDASVKSSILASSAKGLKKIGFGFDPKGYVFPFNKKEEKWFEMGAFDDLKKANTKTYQSIMLDILGLKNKPHKIILNLSDDEKKFAEDFAKKKKLGKKPVIGLNTGSSARWPQKQWNADEVVKFINSMHKDADLLLFGGPEEIKRNTKILSKTRGKIIDTGCSNSLREFFALISLCDVLIASDTLALHAACASGKKVIAIFGPTSKAEIDLYGKGEKVSADLDCLCCYLTSCGKDPSCMDLVKAGDVAKIVLRMI